MLHICSPIPHKKFWERLVCGGGVKNFDVLGQKFWWRATTLCSQVKSADYFNKPLKREPCLILNKNSIPITEIKGTYINFNQ